MVVIRWERPGKTVECYKCNAIDCACNGMVTIHALKINTRLRVGWQVKTLTILWTGILLANLQIGNLKAAEPAWPNGTYNYVVLDQDLRDVLRQFGINTGLKISLTDKVAGHVRGPLPAVPPRQFLEGLARQYGLDWLYDGSIISISASSEARTEMVDLGKVSFKTLHDGLSSVGLLDPRYQFRPTMSGRAVLVSGPPRYIELVNRGLAAAANELPAKSDQAPPVSSPSIIAAAPKPASRTIVVMRGAVTANVLINPTGMQ